MILYRQAALITFIRRAMFLVLGRKQGIQPLNSSSSLKISQSPFYEEPQSPEASREFAEESTAPAEPRDPQKKQEHLLLLTAY